MMKITVASLAQLAGGRVIGNGDAEITSFAPINEAKEGAVTFLSNPKYADFVYSTNATAILVGEDFITEKDIAASLIVVKDVYSTLSTLLAAFSGDKVTKTGIENPSFISESSALGKDVYIGAFAYLGKKVSLADGVKIFPHTYVGDNVSIAEGTVIYAGVKIYANTVIGKNCIIHSGAVIGSDGFGFAPQPNGTYQKMPQTGNVIIGNDVEIGANTTIDRATLQSTLIGNGVKLDNLIQIAHNVEVGDNTAMAAQAGVSGSTKIGRNVMVGGQVGFAGHIKIADGVMIAAQSGVAKSITEKSSKWFGSPADEFRKAAKSIAAFRNLPEILKKFNKE